MGTTAEQAMYERWLREPAVDEATKAELRALAGDEETLRFRFYRFLSFGTAGLRGVMNAGTNAMNLYTVGCATQGLAGCIRGFGTDAMRRGVAIAYDCRNNSRAFAERAASVLAANGIRVYLFEDLRPTPVLSFAVLRQHCIAGINITASHNPKQYNGYKVYWEDGAQISGDIADRISAQIAKTDIFNDVKIISLQDAEARGLLTMLGAEIDDAYLAQVEKQAVDATLLQREAGKLRIVYSPLYGTGYALVPRLLRHIGVAQLTCVENQMVPNGGFPGVEFPNPEYSAAFEEGIKIAERVGSDLIIATDPDADRVGVMARREDGCFAPVSGNQMGCLLLDYLITAQRRLGALPKDAYAVKSIVSTAMADRICALNGVSLYSVYTGFKYIAQIIEAREAEGNDGFLLGFEESYGYLRGNYAKDKDGVVATMLICEMAAYYETKGMTLHGALADLYRRYGCYCDCVDNLYMEGLDGIAHRTALMSGLRENPPKALGTRKVACFYDYLSGTLTDADGVHPLDLAEPSDMVRFVTEDDNTVIIRPSGTEPKIKIYYQARGNTVTDAEAVAAALSSAMHQLIQ